MAEWVEGPSPVLIDCGIRNHGLKPISDQTNDLKLDTYRFLARHSGLGKDWLAQCPDNVTAWYIKSWC